MSTSAFEMKKPANITSEDTSTIYQSLVIKAPIAKVYERAQSIKDLPAFIGFVRDVEMISDARFVCTCVADGYETDAFVQILVRVPPKRIAWLVMSDSNQAGMVAFDRVANGRTRVTVKLRSTLEPISLTRSLRGVLNNFKRFVEREAGKTASFSGLRTRLHDYR